MEIAELVGSVGGDHGHVLPALHGRGASGVPGVCEVVAGGLCDLVVDQRAVWDGRGA